MGIGRVVCGWGEGGGVTSGFFFSPLRGSATADLGLPVVPMLHIFGWPVNPFCTHDTHSMQHAHLHTQRRLLTNLPSRATFL
jgi:hypothetical protein